MEIQAYNNSDLFIKAVNCLNKFGVKTGSAAESVNSTPTVYLDTFTATVSDPRDRWLSVKGRKSSAIAAIAETLWVLAGRDDLEYLTKFLKRAPDFSDDGKTWRAAYKRIFNYGQFDTVVNRLKADKNTRQAYLSIYDPYLDSEQGLLETIGSKKTKDMVCNFALLFYIEDNKLNMTVTNRSQDVLWGMSSINFIEFSVIQEIVANLVGVELGTYKLFSNNLHYYQNEITLSQISNVNQFTKPILNNSTPIDLGKISNQNDLNTLFNKVCDKIIDGSTLNSIYLEMEKFGISEGLLVELVYVLHSSFNKSKIDLSNLTDEGLINALKWSDFDYKKIDFNHVSLTQLGSRNYRCLECGKILGTAHFKDHLKHDHSLDQEQYLEKHFGRGECIIEGCSNLRALAYTLRNGFTTGCSPKHSMMYGASFPASDLQKQCASETFRKLWDDPEVSKRWIESNSAKIHQKKCKSFEDYCESVGTGLNNGLLEETELDLYIIQKGDIAKFGICKTSSNRPESFEGFTVVSRTTLPSIRAAFLEWTFYITLPKANSDLDNGKTEVFPSIYIRSVNEFIEMASLTA